MYKICFWTDYHKISPHFDEINEFLEIFEINRFNKMDDDGPFLSHNQSCT